MADVAQYTNRCACGWEVTGPENVVIEATIDHGRRIHHMEATRDEVRAALHGTDGAGGAEAGADTGAPGP